MTATTALRAIALAAILALLPACATAPAPERVPVLVPVVQPCPAAADKPQRPALPLGALTRESPPDAVARAYAAAVALLRGYAEALEARLDACR